MVNPVRSVKIRCLKQRCEQSGKKYIYIFSILYLKQKKHVFFRKLKPTLEEARDIFQLRDVVLPKFTVFGQQWQVLQVFPAGVSGVQLVELPVHNSPSLHLLLCELNTRNGIPTATRGNNSLSVK